jgi:hypothetical protein
MEAVEILVKFPKLWLLLDMPNLRQVILIINYQLSSGDREFAGGVEVNHYALGLRAMKNWMVEEFSARREPNNEAGVLVSIICSHKGHEIRLRDG